MPHLRGQTPESLALSLPGLDLGVARRVVHRVVGEDRDDLAGVRGLSKAHAEALAAGFRLDRLAVVDRRRSALDPVRQVPVPLDGRSRVRGRAHPAREAALQRVRVVAGRLRARLPLLRDRPAGLRAQPRAVGDRRAGAHGPPRVARAPADGRRLPGPGRAPPQLRGGHPGGPHPARPLRPAHRVRPHHDLDRGPAAPDRALHGGGPPVPADPVAHLGLLGEARAARPDHGTLRCPRAGRRHASARRAAAEGRSASAGC